MKQKQTIKTTYFYANLVELSELRGHLAQTQLNQTQQEELLSIAHTTIHTEIMHFSLSQLPETQRAEFLKYFSKRPHDQGLLHFLKGSIENFEKKIQNLAHEVEQKFIDELREYEAASLEWLQGEAT